MPSMNCEVCGNSYDKAFQLIAGGTSHVFDSLECAIQAIAPRCAQCQCRIIGHGTEAGGRMFCSAHCAHSAGFESMKDRI